MKPIIMIMIYYWDKKLKKRLYVLEADMITIKNDIDASSSKIAQSAGVVEYSGCTSAEG